MIVPILGMFASFTNATFLEILAALAAIICFIGGPLRMLFAALFEEGAPRPFRPYGPPTSADARAATVCATPRSALHCRQRPRARRVPGEASKHGRVGKSAERHRKYDPLAGKRRSHRSIAGR